MLYIIKNCRYSNCSPLTWWWDYVYAVSKHNPAVWWQDWVVALLGLTLLSCIRLGIIRSSNIWIRQHFCSLFSPLINWPKTWVDVWTYNIKTPWGAPLSQGHKFDKWNWYLTQLWRSGIVTASDTVISWSI